MCLDGCDFMPAGTKHFLSVPCSRTWTSSTGLQSHLAVNGVTCFDHVRLENPSRCGRLHCCIIIRQLVRAPCWFGPVALKVGFSDRTLDSSQRAGLSLLGLVVPSELGVRRADTPSDCLGHCSNPHIESVSHELLGKFNDKLGSVAAKSVSQTSGHCEHGCCLREGRLVLDRGIESNH